MPRHKFLPKIPNKILSHLTTYGRRSSARRSSAWPTRLPLPCSPSPSVAAPRVWAAGGRGTYGHHGRRSGGRSARRCPREQQHLCIALGGAGHTSLLSAHLIPPHLLLRASFSTFLASRKELVAGTGEPISRATPARLKHRRCLTPGAGHRHLQPSTRPGISLAGHTARPA
jgi:hypothetical protein